MSEEAAPEAGANVDVSAEPVSQEIGSGNVEASAQENAGLQQPVDGAAMDQLSDDVEAAIEDGATEEEIQEIVETFKLKVNGQEKEVTLDWNNKEDIIRRLQMAEAGQSAMQRASDVEKNFDSFLTDAQSNPQDLLAQLGYDPVEFAEQIINDQIKQLSKTPDQIAQEERDFELEELRQRLKEEEDSRRNFEFQQLQQREEISLDKQITEALSSTTELPKSPYVVKRIADAMLNAMANGQEDVTVNDVLPWVQNEINEEMSGMFAGMEDKVLEKFIGKKTSDRLRNQRLNKMKAPAQTKFEDTGKVPESEEDKRKKRIKMNDWLKGRSNL